jgi:hypothetical protein
MRSHQAQDLEFIGHCSQDSPLELTPHLELLSGLHVNPRMLETVLPSSEKTSSSPIISIPGAATIPGLHPYLSSFPFLLELTSVGSYPKGPD